MHATADVATCSSSGFEQEAIPHMRQLYAVALRLTRDRCDAEDLVQDTFARVLARPRVIRGDERGYLLRALRNTFYSRLRSDARRPQTAAIPEDNPPPDPRTAQQPERAVETREILEAISRLPEDFRLALVAVDILGLSYAEAARALETREATITTRLFRARRRISRAFSEAAPGEEAREGSGPKRSLA